MKEPEMTLRLAEDIRLTETEQGAVLLDTRRGKYFQLNPTAVYTLRGLLDGAELPEVVARLAGHYQTDPERITADVTRVLTDLRAAKLVIEEGS